MFYYLRSSAFLVLITDGVCILTKYIPEGYSEAFQLIVWKPDKVYAFSTKVVIFSPSILKMAIETMVSDGIEYEIFNTGLKGFGYKLWIFGTSGRAIASFW